MNIRNIFCAIVFALALSACSDDEAPDNIEPQLTCGEASGITRTEAVLTGTLELADGTEMPSLHFIYGVTPDMSLKSDPPVVEGSSVSATITGLTPGTSYSYCLTGTNGRVTLTSNVMTFTTLPNDKPIVTTPSVVSQGPLSVIVKYAVTEDGGEPLTATGCYITDSATGETVQSAATLSSDTVFTVRIGDLTLHHSYLISAYAVNRVGESVSTPLGVTTSNAVTLDEAGTLSLLFGDDLGQYRSLAFAGPMNGDDLCLLRKMMGRNADGTSSGGRLVSVNMADVSIVAGGGSYGSSRFTEDDVVGYGLFADCENLEQVILPDSALTVEADAFKGCTSLTSINIPAAATSVLPSDGCTSLASVSVSSANKTYSSVDGVLFTADGTGIVWFPIGKEGDYVLPSTVTSIGDYAFRGCRVSRFVFPDGLESLGQAVFYGSMVEEVVLPDGLRMVPTATFQHCYRLSVVRLGSMAEYVSDYAFDGCPLTDIYVDAAYPPVCTSDAFAGAESLFDSCVLHVPSGRQGFYKADSTWGRFKNIETY